MATTTQMCNSWKQNLLEDAGLKAAGGNAFKFVLIKVAPSGTYGKASTNYSDITGNSDEASGTGYTVGGKALTNIDAALDTDTAVGDFADLSWTSSTIDATAGMIVDTTNSNRAVATYDFGGTKSTSNGAFDIAMPSAAAATAILRLA